MDELSRGRKENKRANSSKRKAGSHQSKRPTSPKLATFYGNINNYEKPMISKPHYHQKVISATNGFEIYNKAEKAYTHKPTKGKGGKRGGSKKQTRIR